MPFPDEPLGVKVELYVAGAWLDITGDVYTNNLITITRGKQDEASRTDAGTCVFVLNNTTGRYSSRNPRSDLYGLIGRNTQVRVSIQPGGASGPRLVRFVGEVSEWPPKWSTARFVTVSASAAGILRRLGQGAAPLASPMRREFANPARTSIVGYWPMEDGSTATEFASALPGGPPMGVVKAGAKPASYSAYAASDALPSLGDGQLFTLVPDYTITGQNALRFFASFPDTAPSASAPIIEVRSSTGMRWVITWEATGSLSVQGYDKNGTVLENVVVGSSKVGKRLNIGLDLTQSGSTLTRRFYYIDVDAYTLANGGTTSSTTATFSGTFGRVSSITVGGGSIGDVALGHIALADSTAAYAATGPAMIGYAGETMGNRLVRLCREENIPLTYRGVIGFPATLVGAQSVTALLDLLQEAIDADGGRLYEQRDALSLAARSRATLYTQTPALLLDYAAAEVADPLEPVDDDQHVTNDVTIVRDGGSSARVVADTGALSVQDPPNGVGRYASSTTLNLFADSQCAPLAYWKLHAGTWDAPRYPSVSVEVHNAPQLAEQVAAADMGDRLAIANPPEWLPPEQIEALVEGYTETLGVYTWDVTFNASPGGPLLVGMTDDAEYGLADTDGSTLAVAASATATALTVRPVGGGLWVQSGPDLPYSVSVGGEEMRVTAVRATAADAFGRTAASGWGTADSGQAWFTVTTAPAADYSVSAGTARHTYGTKASFHANTLNVGTTDCETLTKVSVPVIPTGDHFYTYHGVRSDQAAANFYFARLAFRTDSKIELSLRKRTPGETLIVQTASANYLGYTAGAGIWVRFRVSGSSLFAKIWPDGTPEPADWQLTATDTAITSGTNVVLRTLVQAANTNTLPVALSFAAFQVTDLQTLTVVRAVNGVTKAQPAGAAVVLTHQAIAAL
ncbi:MAG: hypothetical protein HOV66_11900 [Streptomycetaceae bacterium]|nr:hypothetical protein [Streptomycetaceae bacterium]